MIISDKRRMLIACPVKTGTNTTREVADRWVRDGGDEATLRVLMNEDVIRHRMAPLTRNDDYRRYMLVRNPFSRHVSAFEYLRRKSTEWHSDDLRAAGSSPEAQWARYIETIREGRADPDYCHEGVRGLHGGRPYMWLDNQVVLRKYLQGLDVKGGWLPWFSRRQVRLIRLEHHRRDLLAALRDNNFPKSEISVLVGYAERIHRNPTKPQFKWFQDWRDYPWPSDWVAALNAESVALGYQEFSP